MGKFSNKIVLITGASRGLGAAVAHYFAREKATLILLARHVEGLEKLDESLDQYGVETTLVPLDLSKPERLESLPQSLGEKYGRLDVVIGNAAILSSLSPVTHYSPRDFEKILMVNYVANWHLMTGLESLLQRSTAPREIFITAPQSVTADPFWAPYAASKAALERLVLTYAAEKSNTPFKINLVNPGVMATNLYAQAMPGIDLSTVQSPSIVVDLIASLASEDCQESGQIFTPKTDQTAKGSSAA
jgi:NAD(P)-dependent dehydrogenase (short-subunit alcohol dehydrogenase family)